MVRRVPPHIALAHEADAGALGVTGTRDVPGCICVADYKPGGGWQHAASCVGHRQLVARAALTAKKAKRRSRP